QLKVFGPVRGHSYDIFKDETLKMSGGWDCAPVVRDRNMGIYQKVTLDATEEVILQNPFVVTTLPQKSTSLADVNIRVEVKNTSDKKISARLDALITLVNEVKFPTYTKYMEGTLRPIRIAQNIMLNAGEKKTIEFSSKDFPSLLIKNPYLWYPNGYGKQYLHHMKLSVKLGNRVSDAKEFDFGIREVSTSLNRVGDEYGRVYFINGKRIFCKGGWIQPDMMLEESKKRIYDEARLMAEANINLISSEDMPSPSETWFESFDKYGLMWWHVFYQCFRMMPGTETANNPLDHDLAVNCVEDMMLRYRNHPSIVTWVGAVEVLMNENLYRKTKDKVNSLDTTRLYLSTTSHHWDVEGLTPYLKEEMPTGTTDDGGPDYNWAPSRYFFAKVQEVHLQMFRNELGMPSIPMYNSLKKFIPTAEDTTHVNSPIFPLDSIWAEHGAWDVSNYCYRSYDNAIRTLFGDPKNTKQYADNAQYINADGYRAMFEAANHRMWDITSGVMIWKLNSCWPDVCWQIY
ncbi:MAG: glycoside hydrolase family 2 TIM barrel-domain containing protein, partial [Bacteroides sp.]